jgi:thioredoxin reductase (NADPH)
MSQPPIHTKVLIIGGGPVGLFAVFMCGMMKLRCCVIDALPTLGGQCQALYPDKPIYDIPGMPAIEAQDLVRNLCAQMAPFEPKVFLNERAEHLSRDDQGQWHVITSAQRHFIASSIILCCGAGAFTPKRPPLENIASFEGQSVFYCVPQDHSFQGKHIVIAGGGDSAVDWAVLLAPQAEQLHIVHRRSNFRAQDHTLTHLEALVADKKITLHTPYQLHSLHGDQGQLSHVTIEDFSGGSRTLKADCLLPFFGMHTDLGPLNTWGLALENQRILINPTTGETNLPGIYAAGDIATYPHKLKLIMTGFAEVGQIAYHLKSYLFPDQFVSFQHSTSHGIQTDFINA